VWSLYSLVGDLQDVGHHQTVLAAEPLAMARLQQVLVAEVGQRDEVDESQRGEDQSALQRDAVTAVGYLPQAAAGQTHRTDGEGQREVAAASRCLACCILFFRRILGLGLGLLLLAGFSSSAAIHRLAALLHPGGECTTLPSAGSLGVGGVNTSCGVGGLNLLRIPGIGLRSPDPDASAPADCGRTSLGGCLQAALRLGHGGWANGRSWSWSGFLWID